MVAIPYLFNEIERIFTNTPLYAIVLEGLLFLSLLWLIVYKRSGRKAYTKEQEDDIIAKYEPEPLVADTDPNHPFLRTRLVQSKAGKRIVVDGHDCLNLATFDFLGLVEDEQITEDACQCIHKYGVGSCGPRGFYGTTEVHLTLEERLAQFMKMEEAALYSYAFSTVASAIPAYAKRGDLIFVDEAVNFAIQKGLDASRSTIHFYKHNDMKDLHRLLLAQKQRDQKNPKKAAKTRRFLISEGIFQNTGTICNLPQLVKYREEFKLRLFLDESVSFGVLGKMGRGVTEHFNVDIAQVDMISSSIEASVASIGGFCVGSHFIVEHQRLSGLGYCFSASLPPLLAQAAISALDRFETQPQMFQQLQQVAAKTHRQLRTLSEFELQGDELSPVKHLHLLKPNASTEQEQLMLREISDKCIERGIGIIEANYLVHMEKNPIRPSIRVTVNRLLTDEEIRQACSVLDEVSAAVCGRS